MEITSNKFPTNLYHLFYRLTVTMAVKKTKPEQPKEPKTPDIKTNPKQYAHPIGPVRPGERVEA